MPGSRVPVTGAPRPPPRASDSVSDLQREVRQLNQDVDALLDRASPTHADYERLKELTRRISDTLNAFGERLSSLEGLISKPDAPLRADVSKHEELIARTVSKLSEFIATAKGRGRQYEKAIEGLKESVQSIGTFQAEQRAFFASVLGVETSESLSYDPRSVEHTAWLAKGEEPSGDFIELFSTYKRVEVTAKLGMPPKNLDSAVLVYDVIDASTHKPTGKKLEIPSTRLAYDEDSGRFTATVYDLNFSEELGKVGVKTKVYVDLGEIRVYDVPDPMLARRAEKRLEAIRLKKDVGGKKDGN